MQKLKFEKKFKVLYNSQSNDSEKHKYENNL